MSDKEAEYITKLLHDPSTFYMVLGIAAAVFIMIYIFRNKEEDL